MIRVSSRPKRDSGALLLLEGLVIVRLDGRDNSVHSHLDLVGVTAMNLGHHVAALRAHFGHADLVRVVDRGEPAVRLKDEIVRLIITLIELELAVDLGRRSEWKENMTHIIMVLLL